MQQQARTFPEAVASISGAARRRIGLITLLFAIIGGATCAAVILTPTTYTARTTLLAKFGREFLLPSDTPGTGSLPANFAQEDVVSSVIEILRSADLANRVVSEMTPIVLYPELAGKDPAVALHLATDRMLAGVVAKPSRRSNVIQVEYANHNPQIAAEALNRYVQRFQAKFLSLYDDDQMAQLQKELQTAERDELEARRAQVDFEQQQHTYIVGNEMEALLKRRAEQESQIARLRDCCAATSAVQELTRLVVELDAQIALVNSAETNLQDLARRLELAQAMVGNATKRVRAARTVRDMNENLVSSVKVIDPATPPLEPARPTKLARIVIGLILSCLVSFSLGITIEVCTRRFSTAAELRRSYLFPVLADVPRLKPMR